MTESPESQPSRTLAGKEPESPSPPSLAPASAAPRPGRQEPLAWVVLGLLLLAGAIWVAWMALGAPRSGPGRISPARSAGAAATATLLAGVGLLVLARVRDAALAAWVLADAAGLMAVLLGAMSARLRVDLVVPGGFFVAALAGTVLAGSLARRLARATLLGPALQGIYALALGLYGARLGRPLSGGVYGALLLAGLVGGLGAWLGRPGAPGSGSWRRLGSLSDRGRALLVLLASFAAFVSAAGPRLGRPSPNNHFVYLADCYLHGRLSLSPAQLRRKSRLRQVDDWARVDRVRLRRSVRVGARERPAGTVLRGTWLIQNRRRTDRFRTTRGAVARLAPGSWRSAGADWYVSFPPAPAVLMAPGVALWGYGFNDVWFAVALASLSPMLLFLLLGRLRASRMSERSVSDDLWLTLLFGLGTVNYFVSVRGEVWFTAQVVGIFFLLLYLHASLGARFPVAAGLALGLATASRVTLLLAVPVFLWELWRARARRIDPGGDAPGPIQWRRLAGGVVRFSVPLGILGVALLVHNWARFDTPFEFGHRYLDVFWRERIQQFGLFDVHYLPRNLASAFVLLPHLQPDPPYLLVSRHGLSLLLVSPALFLVVWPRRKGAWHRPLWISVAGMAALVFFYQNTGFVQFSYRFSLDFTVLLILLIALGGRRLTPGLKVLILWGVLWNLLGAVSFGLAPDLYGRTNWVWTPMDPGCHC